MFTMEYIKNVFAFLKRKLDPNYVFNVSWKSDGNEDRALMG